MLGVSSPVFLGTRVGMERVRLAEAPEPPKFWICWEPAGTKESTPSLPRRSRALGRNSFLPGTLMTPGMVSRGVTPRLSRRITESPFHRHHDRNHSDRVEPRSP